MQSPRLMTKSVMAVWDKAFTHNIFLFNFLLSKSTFLLSCVLYCRFVYYFAELRWIHAPSCERFDSYHPKYAKKHIYSVKEIKCILIVVLWLLWTLKLLVAKLPYAWLLVNDTHILYTKPLTISLIEFPCFTWIFYYLAKLSTILSSCVLFCRVVYCFSELCWVPLHVLLGKVMLWK